MCTAIALLFLACGGHSHGKTPPPSPGSSPVTPAATTARSEITLGQARVQQLNISEQRFVETYGPPVKPFTADGRGRRCGIYDVAGYSPSRVQWRVCFVNNKLSLIATFYPGSPGS
jgi:hypothetical protein